MFLHQEYLNRHDIDVGWMGYPLNGTLVFRSTNPDRHRWLLLSFQQCGPEYHPQQYNVDIVTPKRNNGDIGGHRRRFSILWDDFEVWVRRYITKAHKLRMVKDPAERELTLWEVFVYCNDQWFADWGFAYKKVLFRTLNLELPLEKRKEHFVAMKDMLRQYPKMLQRFESNASHYQEDRWIGENDEKLFNSNG
tara:strand:- start:1509 stop:2087 length:579 start_codon:yes stop_codon:yes gene_type:complete